MRRIALVSLTAAFFVFHLSQRAPAQLSPTTDRDSDVDGISDETEQAMLVRFAPRFMTSSDDCARRPAEFVANSADPTVVAENGTIYGQVFRHGARLEIRYYHLWSRDCGRISHPLDSEHVSVLAEEYAGQWEAVAWYAAAHEDTLCERSQIQPAPQLGAEHEGATVWISAGKHAAFFGEALCRRGCGADRCTRPTRLEVKQIVNLGEGGHPMNGAVWVTSPRWPLAAKMQRSDFPELGAAAVEQRERPHVQAVISAGGAAMDGVETGGSKASGAVNGAVAKSENETGSALALSYRKVKRALATSQTAINRQLKR